MLKCVPSTIGAKSDIFISYQNWGVTDPERNILFIQPLDLAGEPDAEAVGIQE